MLVDGSLLANVPVQAMRGFKAGPNVVISFEIPQLKRFKLDYHALPSRFELIWRMLNPLLRARLPPAPSPVSVLLRSLMVGRHDFKTAMDAGDLLLAPPMHAGDGLMDWHHYARLKEDAYAYGLAELTRLKAAGHPLLKGDAPP